MKLLNPVLLVMCNTIFCYRFAFAADVTCDAGKYGKYGWPSTCLTCPTGCFCIGGKQPASWNADNGWCARKSGISGGWEMYAFNKDGSGSPQAVKSTEEMGRIDEANNKILGVWAEGGLRRCPKDYPLSDGGTSAKSIEDCYMNCTSKKFYYKKIHCAPGSFLHYKTNECYKCEGRDNDPSLSKNAICIGGDFYPNCGMSNQGTQTCKDGTVPDKERKKCITPTEKCTGNYVLNKQNNSCTECKDGTVPNADHTACREPETITVEHGQYLPKAKNKPVSCKNGNYYCPGGDYKESDEDQGIFNCPKGTRQNKKGDACQKGISKEQMLYGSGGKGTPVDSQCWTMAGEPEKYRECVFNNNRYYK